MHENRDGGHAFVGRPARVGHVVGCGRVSAAVDGIPATVPHAYHSWVACVHGQTWTRRCQLSQLTSSTGLKML